jgi:hypothetical protein
MRVKRPSFRLMATPAIFTAILFMTSNGAAQEKVLHTFLDNGVDGTSPQAGLIFDATGNLYGTLERRQFRRRRRDSVRVVARSRRNLDGEGAA